MAPLSPSCRPNDATANPQTAINTPTTSALGRVVFLGLGEFFFRWFLVVVETLHLHTIAVQA